MVIGERREFGVIERRETRLGVSRLINVLLEIVCGLVFSELFKGPQVFSRFNVHHLILFAIR